MGSKWRPLIAPAVHQEYTCEPDYMSVSVFDTCRKYDACWELTFDALVLEKAFQILQVLANAIPISRKLHLHLTSTE